MKKDLLGFYDPNTDNIILELGNITKMVSEQNDEGVINMEQLEEMFHYIWVHEVIHAVLFNVVGPEACYGFEWVQKYESFTMEVTV